MRTVNGIVAETKTGEISAPVASDWTPALAPHKVHSLRELKQRAVMPTALLSVFALSLIPPIRHLLPQPFWIALVVALPGIIRIARDPSVFTEKDPDFLLEATEGQALVHIEIKQEGQLTGRDRGVLWVDGGRLVFSGQRSAFVICQADLTRECRSRLVGPERPAKGWEWAERICLQRSQSSLEVRVIELSVPKSGKDNLPPEPENALVRFARLFVDPGPNSVDAVVAEFARGTYPIGPSQYPPIKIDPQIHYPLSATPWIIGATLSAVSCLRCYLYSQLELLFIAAMILAFCGYESYRSLRFQRLRRQNP